MAAVLLQKKIGLLGSVAAGKTSLVQRTVNGVFDEKCQTTVGVKINKKHVTIDQYNVMLMLWDIAGENEFAHIRTTQLSGMAAYVLVVDGISLSSFDTAMSIHHALQELGELPMVFALNKVDLKGQWVLNNSILDCLLATGYPVLETSAKSAANVDRLFENLGRQLVEREERQRSANKLAN